MAFIGNSPTQGVITGGNIVDGSIESIDLATLTNIDINSGSIDGTVIGATTPAAVTTTALVATTADINAGTIDGTVIGGTTPAALSATTGSFSSTLGVTAAATFASTLKTGGGAASNTSKLMVNTASGTAAGIQLFQDGVESWIIQNPASTTALTFANSGSERLRITATGNVGIGTSSPANKLDVRNTSTDYQLHLGDTASTVLGYELGRENTGGFFKFYGNQTGATGYIFSGVDGERMRIDASGNLGIGTVTTGSYRFNSNRADGNVAFFTDGTTADLFIKTTAGVSTISPTTGVLALGTSSTERMRIDASGNVGIGNSNPSNYNAVGSSRLVVGTNVGNNGITIVGATTGFSSLAFADSAGSGGNDDYAGLIQYSHITNNMNFFTNSTQKMVLDSSGNVGIGTSSPAARLDIRGSGAQNIYLISTSATNQTNVLASLYNNGAAYSDLQLSGLNLLFHSSASGTESMRIDSSGHLIVPNGITLGTAVGTYNAANTLDDYEEGTWTPALTFETAGDLSVVYAAERIGTYSKIGDLVIAQFSVQCTTFTHTTASGNLQMTGLPFASVRNTTDFSGVGLNSFQGITKANYTQIGATTLNGGSYIFFSICGSGQGALNVAAADMPSGTLKLLRGTVIYRA